MAMNTVNRRTLRTGAMDLAFDNGPDRDGQTAYGEYQNAGLEGALIRRGLLGRRSL
jgi:hypothetical protein